MRILSELTYSLPDHLTNVPGAYSRIAGILERNTEDINAILRLSADRDGAESEAAANYEKLANAGAVLGRYEEALTAQETAIGSYEELMLRGAEGSGEKLASAYNNLGNLYNEAGRYEEAAAAYQLAIARQTAAGEDRQRLAEFYLNAGANATDLGNEAEAVRCYDACIALLGKLRGDKSLEAAARVHQNYGVLLYRAGKYAEAEEHLREACASSEALLEQVDSLQNRSDYLGVLNALATVLTDAGKFDEADEYYELAIEAAEELARDEENTKAQQTLGMLYNNRALSLNIRGDYLGADAMYRHAAEIYEKISEKTGAASDKAMSALMYLNLGENGFKLGAYENSRGFFKKGLKIYLSALDELGDYDQAQYEAWYSYYLLIHERDYAGALDAALMGYKLQPNNVLVNMNLAYACLYYGYYEDADDILCTVAGLGEGQAETIRRDLAAQQKAGLVSEHMPVLLALLDGIGTDQ
jgi:tetratricopeptide (TPR) repeat protein